MEILKKKTNIIFSASSLDDFQICKKLYYYKHILKKTVPIFEKSPSLDFGGLTHKGLEVYFKELSKDVHYNDRMQSSLMKIRESASDVNTSNIDIEKELPIILKAIEESCDFWRFEDEQLEILGVEEPFDYILHEDDYIRIIMSGKIDLRVNKPKMPGSSEYLNLPIDHKTYKRAFPVDRSNNQFINYVSAVNSNYLIYNGIGLQKSLKSEEKYRRIPLSYDPIYIQSWKDNIISEVINFYIPAMMNNAWPTNFTACRKFGRLCEFHPIDDSSGEEAKMYKLNSLYVDREPWDKYKDVEIE